MSAKRIYIVDDERVIASTLAIILNQSGYAATAFYSPLEALNASEAAAPDILLSDVVMPQMTGVDLAIEMRKRHPASHLILFSGQSTTSGYIEEAQKNGYRFEVLPKPIHPADLLKRLASMSVRIGAEE